MCSSVTRSRLGYSLGRPNVHKVSAFKILHLVSRISSDLSRGVICRLRTSSPLIISGLLMDRSARTVKGLFKTIGSRNSETIRATSGTYIHLGQCFLSDIKDGHGSFVFHSSSYFIGSRSWVHFSRPPSYRNSLIVCSIESISTFLERRGMEACPSRNATVHQLEPIFNIGIPSDIYGNTRELMQKCQAYEYE